jgi:hypothetical protein
MIETYHYAGFSVQTAIAKEQRDRDAAMAHSFAKDTDVLRCSEDIFLENAENRRLLGGGQSIRTQATLSAVYKPSNIVSTTLCCAQRREV